jgi:hypothetical protein
MAEHGEDQILDPPDPNTWDQVRTVDKAILVQKLGHISNKNSKSVLSTLVEMFEEQVLTYLRLFFSIFKQPMNNYCVKSIGGII